MNKIKNYISKNLVVIFFAVLCILAYLIAGQAPYVVASDLINRVMRNSIMVLALIIPIMTGMGLNFGIVVGLAPYRNGRNPCGAFDLHRDFRCLRLSFGTAV